MEIEQFNETYRKLMDEEGKDIALRCVRLLIDDLNRRVLMQEAKIVSLQKQLGSIDSRTIGMNMIGSDNIEVAHEHIDKLKDIKLYES